MLNVLTVMIILFKAENIINELGKPILGALTLLNLFLNNTLWFRNM